MKPNKEQEKAINTIQGPVILVSCPGSGKTTTLLRRILHMIETGISPSQILMITFTKAAAAEMQKKYGNLSGPAGVTFSTIHSLCLRILFHFGGYTMDNIMKESDAKFFITNLARKDFRINDPVKAAKSFFTAYSAAVNNRVSLDQMRPEGLAKESFLYLAKRYEDLKKEENKIDFDDMLIKTHELLCQRKEILNFLWNKWSYIQVDEYQDVNEIQKEIVYLLAKKSRNLCVAGDDDQSIYGFRGARPEIMQNFTKDFGDAVSINISTNYRSYPLIITQAGNLILNNKKRLSKKFLSSCTGNAEIYFQNAKSVNVEIQQLTRDIKENDYAPSDIAVLYRNNSQAEAIANLFFKNNLPFVCTENIPDSYESWIWSDIMAYYRLSQKTGSLKDLERIIEKPKRYLLKVLKAAKSTEPAALFHATTVLEEEWQRGSAVKAINKLVMHLDVLGKKEPLDFYCYLMDRVGYNKYLKNYANSVNMDFEEIQTTLDVFEEDAGKFKTMDEWLKYIKERSVSLKNTRKDGITLSTMHRAKGLEWKCVYIIGCNEDIIPSQNNKSEDAIEEERRLFYVAVTRAKESLHLMYVKNPSGEKKPSRFLEEMRNTEEKKSNSDIGFHKNDIVTHARFGICIVLDARGNKCHVRALATGKEYTILKEYLNK